MHNSLVQLRCAYRTQPTNNYKFSQLTNAFRYTASTHEKAKLTAEDFGAPKICWSTMTAVSQLTELRS